MCANRKSQNRLSWIDSLKGIAICGVLLVHNGGGNFSTLLDKIVSCGQYGVQIFFILSAYLSLVSYERFKQLHSSQKPIRWIASRFIKIAPIFYLAILFYGLVEKGNAHWLGEIGHITVGNIISHLTFTHGFFPHYIDSIIGVEWYIGTLAVLYVLVPLIYRFINSPEKSVAFFLLSSLLAFSFSFFVDSFCRFDTDAGIYYCYFDGFCFIAQLPVMALGVVLFHIMKSDILSKLANKKLLSYSLFVFSAFLLYGMVNNGITLFGINVPTVFALVFMLIIISVNLSGNIIIDNRLFAVLGKYSYIIYLSHMGIMHLYVNHFYIDCGNAVLNWVIKYAVILAVSLAVSVLIENLFNKPLCAKLMKRINKP